ncbi:MAG: hypothetical protein CME06_05190 [Gemmatimonadetes bacterium]|nr:hypothetical protein [Gemmatimonadota bacterium]
MIPLLALAAALTQSPVAQDPLAAALDRIEALEQRIEALQPQPALIAGPVMAYDSGWIALTKGEETTVTHAVGGDPDRYIVLFDTRSDAHGQHHIGYGGRALDGIDRGYTGAYYYGLDTNVITLRRATDDTFCHEVKVRIVTY